MGSENNTKLIRLSRELRGALSPIVERTAGPGARPALLVRRLEIDRSLASRITRALRLDNDLEFLHLLPAPTGLRIFLEAAARVGADATLLRAAGESVDRFHALIDETPGGRATLHAGITAHSPQARERNEKSAKQAIYKAMSYLVGVQCDGVATGFLMQPAEDGRMVECLDLSHKVGIRRLRPTAPVGLFGQKFEAGAAAEGYGPRQTTLGRTVPRGPEDLILSEFSSDSLPDLEAFRTGAETTIALAEDEPPMDAPLTITMGWFLHGVFQQHRTPDCADDCRAYMISFPCRTLVRDVFLRDDLHVGIVPEVTQYLPRSMRPEMVRYQGLRGRLDTVDVAAPVEHLGLGLGKVAVREIPSYAPLLEHAFARAGWDASRFRGYRLKETYPVPFLYTSWWFPLADAPGGT